MASALWTPSRERVEQANLTRFLRFVQERFEPQVDRYAALYTFSIQQPERFWTAVWEFCGVRASGDLEPVVDDVRRMPGARWFPNVRLNFAQNLLRHRDDRPALIGVSELGRRIELSYAELHVQVSRVAAGLRAQGVGVGDRVAGYLPNIPETIIAMLATSSIGAVWSSCSPDFGVQGVVDRFGQIEPKVLFTSDGYPYGGKRFVLAEKLAEIVARLPSIERVVVVPLLDLGADAGKIPRAIAWQDFLGSSGSIAFEALPFDHPLYVLYSSGTTGVPKCIVHGQGGTLLQHLKELVLHTDLKREDHFIYYTTCGWMMWNWMASALAVGATVVVYEGSPFHPSGEVLWDLIDAEQISVFGTSAKYLSALEKAGVRPAQSHKLLHLRSILSTGSPLLPESYDYVYRDIKPGILLASISGGTDIVSCFALGNPLLPVYRGELQCRGLGMKVEILDDSGQPVVGVPGELACTQAFPSMPIYFWNDPDGSKYRAAYFEKIPGVWCHGDHAMLTEHEGLVIFGRSDATLNPGGVRIGTAEIYRQVEKLPEVLESLAVGQDWQGDVRVVLFVRLAEGLQLDDALRERIKRVIRDNTTPRHVPARIVQVPDLPRTRSGKLSELAVRDVIHGRAVKNTEALANPESLDYFRDRAELAT